jgi:hypothetical protein
MKTNMGTLDRVARFIAAAIVIALYFMNIISGTLAIILLVFAGIFILTSFMSFCPLYLPFGISTKEEKK